MGKGKKTSLDDKRFDAFEEAKQREAKNDASRRRVR